MMQSRFDFGPPVEPLTADRRELIRATLLEEITREQQHSAPRHSARRSVLLTVVAVLGVGGAVVGTNALKDSPSTVALASAAGSLPVSTAECSPVQTTDPSALEGATFLLQSLPPASLTDVWITVDECPRATPLAVLFAANGTADDAALTIWGGDAQSPLGSLENFEHKERVSLGPDAENAWLVDFGWGVWIEWRSSGHSYLVTSAGLDRDTVISVARSYQNEGSAEQARRAVPRLDAVAPLPSSDRAATWYAEYGTPDPAEKDGDPWVRVEVSLNDVPWAARASVKPIPAGGLTIPASEATEVRSGDNGGFRYAIWTTASGAEVQLMSNLPEAEVLDLVDDLQLTPPDDPRLDGFDLKASRANVSVL